MNITSYLPAIHQCARAPHALRHVLVVCALLLFNLSSTTAHAQETDPGNEEPQSAADDYARAIKLYNEGKNREALQAFNAAISKSSEPVYLCNRAVVLMTLEEYALAISDLKTCRDTYEMSDRERAYIDAQLKALSTFEYVLQPKSRVIAERVANPPRLDNTDPDGRQGEGNKDSEDRITSPPDTTSPLRAAGWVALGTGAGALLGVGALEFITRDEVKTFRQECLGKAAPYTVDCAMLQSTLSTQQKLSRVLLISGGVLSITGASLLWLSRPRDTSNARSWRLSPSVSHQGAALHYQLTF